MAASTFRTSGDAAPAPWAALHAIWAAALTGAVALAALFTVTALPTLEYSVVHMSMWHSPLASSAEINAAIASVAARTFVVSLILSLVITAPASAFVMLCAYPFLHELRSAGRTASAIAGFLAGAVGFLIGALIWANLIRFVPWMSWFIVAGLAGGAGYAGCAGALAFARLRQQR